MLNIIFGRENCQDFVLDTRIYFRRNKKPGWFEDSFVKKFLKEIDGSTVLFEEALKDYKGRGISTEMISTGCKTLCCIYYHGNDTVFYGSGMGDNCIPFLMEIAARNDITIVLEHYMDFPGEYFEKKLVSINGTVLTQDTYDDAYSGWCASGEEEI
ncbi:MAG: DUF4869 domain-containing protein [Lachnospiraceae bacterium]|nr:DUF4869 domain-containing protein [Lachnospiraceae bacterium]